MPDPIFDLGAAVATKHVPDLANNVIEFTKAFQTAKSIADRASKSIQTYPVIVSESLQEIDLMSKISKHLEQEYALFTLISANLLDPSVTTAMNMITSVEALGNIAIPETNLKTYRSFEVFEESDDGTGFDDIGGTSGEGSEKKSSKKEAEDENVDWKERKTKAEALKLERDLADRDKPTEYRAPTELEVARRLMMNRDISTLNDANFDDLRRKYMDAPKEKGKRGDEKKPTDPAFGEVPPGETYVGFLQKLRDSAKNQQEKDAIDLRISDEIKNGRVTVDPKSIEAAAKASKLNPTVVSFSVPFGDRVISASLVIKANLHVVSTVEIDLMLERAFMDGNLFHRVIQLTTGEIKFFSDFLLQLDRASKDEELYKALGRHPWYRKLEETKGKAGVTKIVQTAWKDLRMNGTVLPTCTLVVTKNELVNAIRQPWAKITRESGIVGSIIKKFMLLGMAVVDQDTDLIYFFYSGFEDPFVYHLKDLKSGGDAMTNMTETLKSMVRKM